MRDVLENASDGALFSLREELLSRLADYADNPKHDASEDTARQTVYKLTTCFNDEVAKESREGIGQVDRDAIQSMQNLKY